MNIIFRTFQSFFIQFIIYILLFSSCSNYDTLEYKKSNLRKVIKGRAQGTTYSIKYFSKDTIVKKDIDSILNEIDSSMSTWNKESIISKFNAGQDSVLLDKHFISNLNLSSTYHRATEGSFNPLVKPLLDYYGLGSANENTLSIDTGKVQELLKSLQLDSVKLFKGSRVCKLDELMLSSNSSESVRLLQSGFRKQFDFNAIAQGYSVDIIADYFINSGVSSFLIELGGEMYAKGTHPSGDNWLIGIDKPSSEEEARSIQAKLRVLDKAIATSGNYRKFTKIAGVNIHHTINPTTGFPAKNTLLSATVVANDCATADAFATAFMVMGLEKSVEFLLSEEGETLDAFLIYEGKDRNYKFYTTQGLEEMLVIDLN